MSGRDWAAEAIANAERRQADPPAEPGAVLSDEDADLAIARMIARRVADDMVAANRPPAPKG